eukprot:maker-scaffold801_size95070-snap-gene-0.16 protein:Tk01645 transcript:maker-scaffold801_size95070-snap-gene-0.16-mRNA-1 annotation:"hypothetical protein DAPPUDRAFT_43721"
MTVPAPARGVQAPARPAGGKAKSAKKGPGGPVTRKPYAGHPKKGGPPTGPVAPTAPRPPTGTKRAASSPPERADEPPQLSSAGQQKEAREKRKALKVERQKKAKSEDIYAMGVEAKRIWERLRQEKCPPAEKAELVPKLLSLVEGHLSQLVYSHDTVRVVECLITVGDAAAREAVLGELEPELIKLVKSQYAGFLVNKLLRHGNAAARTRIAAAFQGHVAELVRHKIANQTVELYYQDFASTRERNALVQEFCGPEFRQLKDAEVTSVKALLAKYPEKSKFVLKYLSECVQVLLAKGCVNLSLVHRVFFEYLSVCTEEQRAELIHGLRDACVHMVHTEFGKRLAVEAIKYGTAKDRKAIVKSFKTFVARTCSEDMGHVAMLAICDAVDDTKLVGQAIVGEIIENLDQIAETVPGRKVLMFLVAPRHTAYIGQDVVQLLERETVASKKDPEVRAAELRALISPALVKYVLAHLTEMLRDNAKTLFLTCLLNYADGMEPCLSQLAQEASQPFTSHDDSVSLVEGGASHRMLKKVMARDRERQTQGQALFCTILLEAMDEDSWDSYLNCNRGCFVVVNMLETEIPEVVATIKDKMKTFKKTLQKQKTNGAEILRKKL